MATDDKGNYGTPISYAIPEEDNEITFTDPFGFVLSVKGKKLRMGLECKLICMYNVAANF